jgi:hypothetical protein
MPKNTYEGDADAYAWELEHPEEAFNERRKEKLNRSIPRRRPRGYVGKYHPPIESRWPPGRSGNPKGRRKGRKNFKTVIQEMLLQKITIREGDKVRCVTRFEAVLLKQLSQALKGDHKAIQAVYASADAAGLMEECPQKVVTGSLSVLTDDELRQYESLLTKVNGRIEPK